MGITHVIRGDEWISSTPKHVRLYECFGWTPPVFMHMPLLLGKDGRKLSKRRNPTSIFYYRDSGYLPEALANFLTLMGYRTKSEKEVYSLEELVAEFEPERIGVSGAFFDIQKLNWLNQQYLINKVPQEKLWERIKAWTFNDEFMQKLVPLCYTRMKTFSEFFELSDFLFVHQLPWTAELLQPKGMSALQVCQIIQGMVWQLDEQEDWGREGFEAASRTVAEKLGAHHKKMVMPILFATLMGKKQGLPLFDSAQLLGKDRARARFLGAMEFLGGLSSKQLSQLQKAWADNSAAACFSAPSGS
jgi:glutamyl-tRNA synthetase